jgi:hypothetical protein
MKAYRCGYCGNSTNENGDPISDEELKGITEDDWNNAEQTHGYCCMHEFEPRMRVTRDMAIDAGDLSLEGEYI